VIRTSRGARTGLVALLAVIASACAQPLPPSSSDDTTPTIAFLFDGSPADSELVTASALAGLELAAHEAADVDVEPVNLGLERGEVMASLRALGEDEDVVAVVVAPWTAPPSGAVELLAEHDLPVVTLSWAWGPPAEGDGPWLSLAASQAREAVDLLSSAGAIAPAGATLCLAGDDQGMSRALLETAAELGRAAGDPGVAVTGIASTERPETVRAVVARIADAGCPVLVWTGGTAAALSVLTSMSDPPTVIGTSRIKTDDGLDLAASGVEVRTVCACADVSLSLQPDRQRFVHDLQAESGAAPGAFALEAYDAGHLLAELAGEPQGGNARETLAAALRSLRDFAGLGGPYTFEADGSRAPQAFSVGRWRAAGSRWLPEHPP
jgi:ABC-type branched-subunit amino acid transport system substrate-binding protein